MNKSERLVRLEKLASILERPQNSEVVFAPLKDGGASLSIEPTDEFASEHYRVFCHELMPAASVFLEPRSMLGGEVSAESWSEMKAAGYDPDTSSITADHLVNQLRFLVHLVEQDQTQRASSFVQRHMLGWIPAFLATLRRLDSGAVSPLAAYIEEAVLHLALPRKSEDLSRSTLIPTLFSLENEKTGLVSIGIFLSTHAESGLAIPKSTLLHIARELRLPPGFGSKSQTIEGLFRAAGGYDSLPALCDFFDDQVELHTQVWSDWSSRVGVPGIAHWSVRWKEKLLHTSKVVKTLRRSATQAAS
ncbi:molecular chaperone TorD family protein [bacterium]|nr:molecular chaperone TorD family protein [bacterium]